MVFVQDAVDVLVTFLGIGTGGVQGAFVDDQMKRVVGESHGASVFSDKEQFWVFGGHDVHDGLAEIGVGDPGVFHQLGGEAQTQVGGAAS